MPAQTIARVVAVGVLAFVCLCLAIFEIQAARGRLIGNEWLGELFVLVIRQDGGIIDLVKQAVLPVIAGATISIKFTRKKDWATAWIWGLLGFYLFLTCVFFFEFQMQSVAEEIWVKDEREIFIRNPDDVAVNQAAFESAIRYFSYQSLVGIVTFGLVLLGIQSRDRLSQGEVR